MSACYFHSTNQFRLDDWESRPPLLSDLKHCKWGESLAIAFPRDMTSFVQTYNLLDWKQRCLIE